MTCKNCSSAITGNFCSNCGQKGEVHRITIKHVIHDFLHAFTHADKGFLLLVKDLLIKPGIVVKEYIEGKRKKYFNPLSFLVICAALHFYAASTTGYFEALSNAEKRGGAPQQVAIWKEVFEISSKYGKTLDLFILVPLITIVAWIFFRKPKYNLAEHFVLQSFVLSEGLIARTLIFIPLFLAFPKYVRWNLMVFQISLLIYLIFAYRQFFHQNIFLTIIKTILIMVLYIVLYWMVLFLYVYLKHLLF